VPVAPPSQPSSRKPVPAAVQPKGSLWAKEAVSTTVNWSGQLARETKETHGAFRHIILVHQLILPKLVFPIGLRLGRLRCGIEMSLVRGDCGWLREETSQREEERAQSAFMQSTRAPSVRSKEAQGLERQELDLQLSTPTDHDSPAHSPTACHHRLRSHWWPRCSPPKGGSANATKRSKSALKTQLGSCDCELALRVARVEQTYHERGKSIERVDRMQYKRKGDEGMMSSEIQRWIINAIKSPSMHA